MLFRESRSSKTRGGVSGGCRPSGDPFGMGEGGWGVGIPGRDLVTLVILRTIYLEVGIRTPLILRRKGGGRVQTFCQITDGAD